MDARIPSVIETSPSMLTRLAALRRELADELFENEGLGTVFAHARNVLTATLIIAAGLYAITHAGKTWLPGMFAVHVAGYAVAGMGGVLLLLNLADGLRRLSQRRHHLALRLLAIAVYLLLSLRLTQVIVYFRAPL